MGRSGGTGGTAARRAYKFLLRPTSRQVRGLSEMLRDHCSLYNAALQERRDAYRHRTATTVRYGDQSAQLKEVRDARRVQIGEKPGYPRFRGVSWFNTVDFPKDGDGCRWDSTPQDTVTRVRVKGIGHIRVHRHRSVRGQVKTVSIKREGARWYVLLACDNVPATPLAPTGAVAGIDMGVVHFLTTSDGEHIENPRFGERDAGAIADAHRSFAAFPSCPTNRRTARHRMAAAKLAKLQQKVRRRRVDHAHKTALALVRRYDQIGHEKLTIANMVRAPRPKPDPQQPDAFLPNGAAAKAGLTKRIMDAGWGRFLGILAHKAESAGRVLLPVNARNTSRSCPRKVCGHVSPENRRTQETFACVKCGYSDNADCVAALNVAIRAGLVLPIAG